MKITKLLALKGRRSFMQEYDKEKERRITQMRTITNYGMGIFFVCAGIFFLLYHKLGINIEGRQPSVLDTFIGVLFVLYGGWRIYRGYKKNYFK